MQTELTEDGEVGPQRQLGHLILLVAHIPQVLHRNVLQLEIADNGFDNPYRVHDGVDLGLTGGRTVAELDHMVVVAPYPVAELAREDARRPDAERAEVVELSLNGPCAAPFGETGKGIRHLVPASRVPADLLRNLQNVVGSDVRRNDAGVRAKQVEETSSGQPPMGSGIHRTHPVGNHPFGPVVQLIIVRTADAGCVAFPAINGFVIAVDVASRQESDEIAEVSEVPLLVHLR